METSLRHVLFFADAGNIKSDLLDYIISMNTNL